MLVFNYCILWVPSYYLILIWNKSIGALPLKPHFLFWLEPKKKAKKFKTTPVSHEKLALVRLNRPNSLLRRSNKDDF